MAAVTSSPMAAASNDRRPLAVVTSVEGTATASSTAIPKQTKVGIADVFYAGDRVQTTGALSIIFCPTSMALTLAAGSEAQFTEKTVSMVRGKIQSQHSIPGCRVPVAEIGGPNSHLAGFQMRGDEAMVVLDSPVNVTVPTGEFHLRWQPVEGATLYRIQIRPADADPGDSSNAIERELSSTDLAFDGAQLKPGSDFRWMVTALTGEQVLAVSSSHFKTLTVEDAGRLAAAKKAGGRGDTESHLLVGMMEDDLDMPEQALAEFTAIPEASRSEWLRQQIAALEAQSKPHI